MTATVSPDLSPSTSRTTQSLLQVLAVIAVLAMLAIGAFALGRVTADDSGAPAVTVHPVTQVQPVTPPAQDPCVRVAAGC